MAGGDHLGRDLLLNGGRQLQQTERIGDLRTGTRDAFGQLFLRSTEISHELLIRGRLFQWIELSAVQVLQKGVPQQITIIGLPDNRGNSRLPRQLGRAETAFTHNEFVLRLGLLGEVLLEPSFRLAIGNRAHDDRLQDTDLFDRGGKFGEIILVEDLTRLLRIGNDLINRDLRERGAWDRKELNLFQCFT